MSSTRLDAHRILRERRDVDRSVVAHELLAARRSSVQPSGCSTLYATMSPSSSDSQKPQSAPPVWKNGPPCSRSSRIVSAAPTGAVRTLTACRRSLAATKMPGGDHEAGEEHRDGRGDDQLDVGVALTAGAHGRSCFSGHVCRPGLACRRREPGRGRPAAAGGTNAATLPRRHRQARLGRPRSRRQGRSPARCATRLRSDLHRPVPDARAGRRGGAPGGRRRGRAVAALGRAHDADPARSSSELRDRGLDEVLVFAGGIIPDRRHRDAPGAGRGRRVHARLAARRRSPTGSRRRSTRAKASSEK